MPIAGSTDLHGKLAGEPQAFRPSRLPSPSHRSRSLSSNFPSYATLTLRNTALSRKDTSLRKSLLLMPIAGSTDLHGKLAGEPQAFRPSRLPSPSHRSRSLSSNFPSYATLTLRIMPNSGPNPRAQLRGPGEWKGLTCPLALCGHREGASSHAPNSRFSSQIGCWEEWTKQMLELSRSSRTPRREGGELKDSSKIHWTPQNASEV
jgi:hypothetical protein